MIWGVTYTQRGLQSLAFFDYPSKRAPFLLSVINERKVLRCVWIFLGEGPFIAKGKVTVAVLNVNYSVELSDKNSPKYQDFETRFKAEVSTILPNLVTFCT